MIKLRGFGGKTEFWEYNLESFTLMAALAAVTEKIKIYATCPTLVIPPAFCARMCNTIDSISHGRFGLNLITGWQRPEYSQMGLWPGDEHFRNRYTMLGEYAHILRELWETGRLRLQGRILPDGRLPRPPAARRRDEDHLRRLVGRGPRFLRQICGLRLLPGQGRQHAQGLRGSITSASPAATAKTGRDVRMFVLVHADHAAETDEEAEAKWKSYNDGVDLEAIAWLAEQGAADKHNPTTNVRQLAAREGAVNINIGTLVGSYAKIASHARRDGRGAQYRRRAPDLRPFRRGRRAVRHPRPAADEMPAGGEDGGRLD